MNVTAVRARRLAAAALALPILLLCAPFLFSARTLAGKDFQSGYGPLFEFARSSWAKDGELPKWNPHHFAGVPFAGNPQASLGYPPNLLYLALSPSTAFEWLTFLHLLLAAAGTYRLARGLGSRRDAAVIAGLSYSLSQAVLARVTAGHYPYFVTVCLAPLVLHLLRLLLDRPNSLHAAGLAAAGAAALLGGSPQFLLQLGLLAAAMAAWRLAARRKQGKPLRASAAWLGASLAIALSLASRHLIPAFRLAADSTRSSMSPETLLDAYGDFNAEALVGFLVPGFPWRSSAELWLAHEKALYAGVLPLLLAVFAMFRDRGGATVFFGAALGVALLAAFGPILPLHHLLSLLPFYAKFRVPERIVWIAVLAVSLLAARGWTLWRDGAVTRKSLGAAGGAVAAAALLLALGRGAPIEALLFALTAAAGLAAVALPLRPAIALAVVLLAADLGGNAFGRLTLLPPGDPAPPPGYARWIGPERSDFRLLDLRDPPVDSIAQGFRVLRYWSYPVPGRLCDYYARAWEAPQPSVDTLPSGQKLRDLAVLRSLNVKWIVTHGEPLHPEWRLVARDGSGALYEDPGALPFASATEGAALEWRRTAAHRIEATVRSERPCRVVLREMAWPGWSARREGREVPILEEQGLMMALEAPAGTSLFSLSYTPPGGALSVMLPGQGFGWLLLWTVWAFRATRRTSGSSPAASP